MAQYNGYRNWNQWNVSLWINNDEGLYREAVMVCRIMQREEAAEYLLSVYPDKTPDGAIFNKTSIKAALVGL